MTKKNNYWLILFLLMQTFPCFAQDNRIKAYVILTYEQKYLKSFEGVNKTFWIVPADSIGQNDLKFFPLFLSDFYKTNIDSCCMGLDIDPSLSTPFGNHLDSIQEMELKILKTIISEKKQKIQTIEKKWNSGNQENITVSATPVVGLFCFSKFYVTAQRRTGYSDLICIPRGKFQDYDQFWNSPSAILIRKFDFSKFNFGYDISYNTLPFPEK